MKKVLLVLAILFCCLAAHAESVNFDKDKTGGAPEGWTPGVTGGGKHKWIVEADASAPSQPNVLKQSGEGTYPYCVKKDVSIKDGFVQVMFKPVAGKEDQAGGIIWRFKDGDNYYITRANALEDNVTIYHTVGGSRVAFKSINTKVLSGVWHTLRIDFKGSKFTVSFDGKAVIEAEDKTFTEAGAVGVWTKADSVTLFDDFQCGETK
jgi:hypothetical protein